MKPELLTYLRLATLSFGVLASASVSGMEMQGSGPKRPLASALQPFVDAHTLAGAVMLVANKEKVLDVEAVGYADIAAGRRMRTDNIFWIAS